jgi:hypothetical protein
MSAYGVGYYGGSFYGGIAVDWNMRNRLLRFVRSGPNLGALASIIGIRGEAFANLCQSLAQAFRLDASGTILDTIGGILQRPRPAGTSDATYQILLQAQVDLILASQGTTETLLGLIERVSGNVAPEYSEFQPAEIRVAAEIDHDLVELLLSLLNLSKTGGVLLTLVEYEPGVDHLVGDLLSTPLADPGVGDLLSTPYADAYVGVRTHR